MNKKTVNRRLVSSFSRLGKWMLSSCLQKLFPINQLEVVMKGIGLKIEVKMYKPNKKNPQLKLWTLKCSYYSAITSNSTSACCPLPKSIEAL